MFLLALATMIAGVFFGAALYVSLVEHPARVSCGAAAAVEEFRPSYRRGAVMQGGLSAVGCALGLAAAWLDRVRSRFSKCMYNVHTEHMRPEYDFSKAKRRALLPTKGKTRITIYIDDAVLEEFRSRAEKLGGGYQTMMNDALRAYLADTDDRPLTESVLRRVIREELPGSKLTKRSGGRSKSRAAAR
jgi:uncharacterized protein (DUF4415 family)